MLGPKTWGHTTISSAFVELGKTQSSFLCSTERAITGIDTRGRCNQWALAKRGFLATEKTPRGKLPESG